MQTETGPVLRDIVLVGGGHSHVGVLRRFGMHPVPGVRLTLICTDTHTPYSGMLPGYVAGRYAHEEVHIDLARLCIFAGARYFRAEAVGLDRAARQVRCRDRPPVPYDLLSLNIGSTPRMDDVPGAAAQAVPVKPIHRFDAHWQAVLARVGAGRAPCTVAVVGAGAGGVELLLAMQQRLIAARQSRGVPADTLRFLLFSAEPDILPTHHPRVRRWLRDVLAARGVQVHTGQRVVAVQPGLLQTMDGQHWPIDEVFWVTQAGGAPWLRETGLALDEHGFIRVDEHLRCISDPLVFAAGDIASIDGHPVEKAGVFAVRQGPPLAENLRRSLTGEPLRRYRPQRRWLALIGTADGQAVASRGALTLRGTWVWRWKDWIDRRFMARFADLPAMATPGSPPASPVRLDAAEQVQRLSALAMRCGGCAAKIGPDVLARALSGLRPAAREDVLIGLDAPDDAAVLRVPPGHALVQTVDFFRAFINDPYVFGQIAANHALGDLYAMGATPHSALALATVPQGLEAKVQDTLFQMMSGALPVLEQAGCALVGGHSGEGRELALGFALTGLVREDLQGVLRKGGMQAGNLLILTKPLGTGTLLVAHEALQAQGRWIDAALDSMRVSARDAARCLQVHGATAATDVTGFGLLGHLIEMTRAAGVDAELWLDALPVLPGATQTAAAGWLSSLHPANLRVRSALQDEAGAKGHAHFPLLFDPQTAGGLLASVPAQRAPACLSALREAGYGQAAIIGCVLPADPGEAPIRWHVASPASHPAPDPACPPSPEAMATQGRG